MARIAIACAAVLVVAGCSTPRDIAGLSGSYVMTIGTDTLHMDGTGLYRRVMVFNASPAVVLVDSGRWMLAQQGRLVALRDLPQRWPQHGNYDPKQGWHAGDSTIRQTVSLVVGSTWTGRTELGVRPEIGWRYLRIQP